MEDNKNYFEPSKIPTQIEAEKMRGFGEAPAPDRKMPKKSIEITLKTAIIIAAILVIGALVYVYKGLFIAATVNGSPISRLSVIQKLEKASGKNLLDSLITDKLIQDAAKAKGISVSDDEVNVEIKKIQDQVTAQGSTLDKALAAQGMSLDDLKNNIILQKEIEKLLGDKINVTDQEIDKYITDNKITLPKGQEAATRGQIKSQLSNQKLNTEAQTFITDLKSKAKIKYFVNY
jgi:foldase protein PrsA